MDLSSENAWVRIASSVRALRYALSVSKRVSAKFRTLEAMRTQARFHSYRTSKFLSGKANTKMADCAAMATYCLPSTAYAIGDATMLAPV